MRSMNSLASLSLVATLLCPLGAVGSLELASGMSLHGNVPAGFSSLPTVQSLRLRGGDAEGEKKAFNLDAWKRIYSNAPEGDIASVLPEFWETLDTEGWSVWFCEYKHSEDYAKAFMATNLIRGWHQRLDGANARKVAFGACHVFGEEPKLELAGCWLIQGQELPEAFTGVDDHELWDWQRADLADPATRATVGDFWKGEEGSGFGKERVWRAGVIYK